MAKVKLNIEIDDTTYEDFKNKFEQFKKMAPTSLNKFSNVEEFIADFLEKMQSLEKSMGNFDPSNLDEMLKKSGIDFSAMNDMFNSKKDEKDDMPKKKDDNSDDNLD